jgi:hypothetical protein
MGDADRVRPIFSSRADDPALVGAIEEFVVGLAERIDHLQDAESEGDLGRLARLAGGLAAEAGELGFEPLAAVSRAAGDAAGADKREETRARLVSLTGVAQRVRLGHPGAF